MSPSVDRVTLIREQARVRTQLEALVYLAEYLSDEEYDRVEANIKAEDPLRGLPGEVTLHE